MMAKHLGIVMAAALLVAAAGTARADEEAKPFGGQAPYASFGGVFGIENNSSSLGSGVSDYGGLSDSGGYDIRVGYNLRDWVAIEGEWQSLLSFSTDGVDPFTLNNLPAVEARMLSFNGRFMPLSGRVQPYGLLGMGWYNVQADRVANNLHESAFAMRFAVGVLAYITERTGVAIEAAYILPVTGTLGGGDRFDLIPITASVFFRFK